MSALPVAPSPETIDARIDRLLTQWRTETAYLSSSSRMQAHPAYQEIIRAGRVALPALFRDLERTRDGHLSRALSEITGANPVTEEQRGKIAAIAQAWLGWAKENGIQW
jgi:hypothetical protein